MSLKDVALIHKEKLKKIKVAVFDVDGVLTDATVYYAGAELGFNRHFCVYDGYGMKLLMEAGIKVGVVTGGDSVSVHKRVEQLELDFSYVGNEDKRAAYLDIMKKYNVTGEQILYMGDELFDIPLLKKSGFAATVPAAVDEVKESVHYVTIAQGGKGAVREVIELVRMAQNIHPTIESF